MHSLLVLHDVQVSRFNRILTLRNTIDDASDKIRIESNALRGDSKRQIKEIMTQPL